MDDQRGSVIVSTKQDEDRLFTFCRENADQICLSRAGSFHKEPGSRVTYGLFTTMNASSPSQTASIQIDI
jgi:hypothetical protein